MIVVYLSLFHEKILDGSFVSKKGMGRNKE